MTLTKTSVVVSSWSSSNKLPIDDAREKSTARITRVAEDKGIRGLLLSTLFLASQPNDSQTQLLQSIYICIYKYLISSADSIYTYICIYM